MGANVARMSIGTVKAILGAVAIGLLMSPYSAMASVVPPIRHGAWLSLREFPTAINSGNYEIIRKRLSPDSVVIVDSDNIRARGADGIIAYLNEWFRNSNQVKSVYAGADSVMFFVERKTAPDKPWDKAYVMIVSFHGDEDVVRSIRIIPRNPNVSQTISQP